MKIWLLTIGTQMPRWVTEGFDEYIKRLPKNIHFELVEIGQKKYNSKISAEKIRIEETEQLIQRIPKQSYVIALNPRGVFLSTEKMADKLHHFQMHIRNLVFLVGGPEGLSPEAASYFNEEWSLSALTFPHPLVRIIMAEQLYRCFSYLAGHPYHRASTYTQSHI